jgi:hypothetical protein
MPKRVASTAMVNSSKLAAAYESRELLKAFAMDAAYPATMSSTFYACGLFPRLVRTPAR